MTTNDPASPGGSVPATKVANSPHASRQDLAPGVLQAAMVGGVVDEEGNATAREHEAVSAARDALAASDPLPIVVRSKTGGFVGLNDNPIDDQARMMMTMGTNSAFFVARRLTELHGMLTKPGEEQDPALTPMNDGIAVVAAVAPTNELEAMLATQMAGAHVLSCELMGRAMRSGNPDQLSVLVNSATKLQRTFTSQIEALARLRGKGQQTVRVEHVTVEPGGQAIVGDVHHHPVSKELAHDTAARTGAGTALPSTDSFGNGVPLAGDDERSVSHARRGKHRRPPR